MLLIRFCTIKTLSITIYCAALLCGRITIDRLGLPMAFERISLSTVLLPISYILIVPELLRTPIRNISDDLCRNPFFWTAVAIIFAGSITAATTGRGTIDSHNDFLLIAMFIIFPILAVKDRDSVLSMGTCTAFIALAIPIILLLRLGDISRDTMTSVISDFSFYRIMILGFCAALVTVFIYSSRSFKIFFFIAGMVLLYASLHTDNKAAMLAIGVSTLGISILAIALRASKFSMIISLCAAFALILSITLNPSAKLDRWISVFNPNYLMERESERRESDGDFDGSLVAQNVLEDARRIESLIDETTYVYMNDTTGRLRLWRSAVTIFTFYPILGSGYGTFASEVRGYYEKTPTMYHHPHNIFLEALVGGGFVGFALIAISILAPIVFAIRAVIATNDRNQKYINLVTLWAMLALLSGSMLNGDIYDARFLWALGPMFLTINFKIRGVES